MSGKCLSGQFTWVARRVAMRDFRLTNEGGAVNIYLFNKIIELRFMVASRTQIFVCT
jgi:hypothetical protein